MRRGDDLAEKLADAFGLAGNERDTAAGWHAETDFPPVEIYGEDAVRVVPGQEPGTAIVGYLAHDDDAAEFFENDEGAGEFREFRSEADRDDFLAEAKRDGKLALVVDKYAHGNIHYSVAGTQNYPDRRWDVAPCGVFVPCQDVQDAYKKAVRKAQRAPVGPEREKAKGEAMDALVKDCNSTLDEYSKWCNGEVYGVVTEVWTLDRDTGSFERQSSDHCWGYIGGDYAQGVLADEMKRLGRDEAPTATASGLDVGSALLLAAQAEAAARQSAATKADPAADAPSGLHR
jgi:hypothetical protein